MTRVRTTRVRATPRAAATAAVALALVAGCSSGGAAAQVGGPVSAAPPPEAVSASVPALPTDPVPSPAATADPPAGRVPRCTTPGLTGSLTGAHHGADGIIEELVLTNTGSATCTLAGFPRVAYVTGDDGHQVGPPARTVGDAGGPVRLDVGAAATAEVHENDVRHAASFADQVCLPTPVRGLRVSPPGEATSLFVAADGLGCSGTPPGDQLTVGSFTEG